MNNYDRLSEKAARQRARRKIEMDAMMVGKNDGLYSAILIVIFAVLILIFN